MHGALPDLKSKAAVRSVATPRIAVNGRFLTQIQKGVQRFASQTVRAMDRLLDTPEYAHLRGAIEIVAPAGAREFPLDHIPVRRAGRLSGYPWEQIELPLHTRGALLLNLCLLGPAIKHHQVIVAHDATVRAMPENFSWRFRTVYDILVPMLLRSEQVVTVSDFSRREIGKYYRRDMTNVPVCYEGADHITSIPADDTVLERIGIAGKPYFLGVGVDSPNKNIEMVVQAFQKAGIPDAKLVLTGKRDPWVHGYEVEVNDPRVIMNGHVTDAELRALYENAIALVYPSRYEGFGLPPIEAMQCGCPVIVSDQGALVEMGGDAVLKCGMNDLDGLTRLIRSVHDDAGLRAQLKQKGLEHVRRFTWAATARMLLDLSVKLSAPRAA